MAGTGKSTIARTIADSFAAKRRLGASFFFSRGRGDRGHVTKLFTTIALQLTEALPDLKRHVCNIVAKHGDIGEQRLRDQWMHLILQPLFTVDKSLLLSLVLVFVIDALDECEGDKDLLEILRLLTEVKDLKKIRVRVFIISRPEIPIRRGFRDMSGIIHHGLMLHSIPRSVIEYDISIFLRHELVKIQNDKSLEKDWPGEEKI